MPDKITTIPISTDINDLVLRLAAKKAMELNLSKLSRTAYIEMLVRETAQAQ